MADDTAAALQALIKQVTTLTEAVEKQDKRLDGLHEFNGRVLDQKKDLQSKLGASHTPENIKQMADMGFEPGDDGNWYKKGTRPSHTARPMQQGARPPQTPKEPVDGGKFHKCRSGDRVNRICYSRRSER